MPEPTKSMFGTDPAGSEEPAKLRLGGMALRNGLLVHGPTHWAAAVRARDGSIRSASGHKPRLKGVDKVAGVRGVVRLGEAMPLIHAADERIDVRDLGFAASFFRDICKELLGA